MLTVEQLPERLGDLIIPEPNTGCALWIGSYHGAYPQITINYEAFSVHRLIAELAGHALTVDEHVHHSCGNRSCVEPRHLVVMSAFDHVALSGKMGAGRSRHRWSLEFDVRREPNGCLIFLGQKDHCGRGRLRGKSAHRIVWEQNNGPIPDGYEIHHICRNGLCIELGHLVLVTKRQHVELHIQTHCKRGHEFTQENTYYPPRGRPFRKCLSCIHERMNLRDPEERRRTDRESKRRARLIPEKRARMNKQYLKWLSVNRDEVNRRRREKHAMAVAA